jgi:hypothetical protein
MGACWILGAAQILLPRDQVLTAAVVIFASTVWADLLFTSGKAFLGNADATG